MTKSIFSDVVFIDKPDVLSTTKIENRLTETYGSLIRWAIIDTTDKKLKICITYEKEVC